MVVISELFLFAPGQDSGARVCDGIGVICLLLLPLPLLFPLLLLPLLLLLLLLLLTLLLLFFPCSIVAPPS